MAILNALPDAVLVVVGDLSVRFANSAAEEFFEASSTQLCTQRLDAIIPADSPVLALLAQAVAEGYSMSEYGVTIETPRIGSRFVTVQVSPLADPDGHVVVTLHEQSIARKIDRQLTHRHAARSVTAMAAMLAHEVKNPLAGIRGAAQLLEQEVRAEDRELTQMICDEADRIVKLVNRMEIFSDSRPTERRPVNIHEVLERVRRVAQSGFARNIRFSESYDPSLPGVSGNFDQLVQVILNLVKNAAEACPKSGGEIVLTTAYRSGVRVAVPGSASRLRLPFMISVQDNGEGIPEEIRPHLFDPFVTTKASGSGLGLALVAKIIGDHGGIIEFDSQPGRTVFRILLPILTDQETDP